jgi:hypothetical protein
MAGERTPISMLMDHTLRSPCYHYVIRVRDLIVYVVKEFVVEESAVKAWDLRLEIRRIRLLRASRDHHGGVDRYDFETPHTHFVMDVTVTSSARTNSNVLVVGTPLPLHGILALGAQEAKPDTDTRTSSSLGTPSIQFVHDYHPFDLEDGGRLAPMASQFVDRLAILVVVRRFPSLGAAGSRSLRYERYVHMKEFVQRPLFAPFRRFLWDVCREFMQVFLWLCIALSVPIFMVSLF